jgi:hypothetical protein
MIEAYGGRSPPYASTVSMRAHLYLSQIAQSPQGELSTEIPLVTHFRDRVESRHHETPLRLYHHIGNSLYKYSVYCQSWYCMHPPERYPAKLDRLRCIAYAICNYLLLSAASGGSCGQGPDAGQDLGKQLPPGFPFLCIIKQYKLMFIQDWI